MDAPPIQRFNSLPHRRIGRFGFVEKIIFKNKGKKIFKINSMSGSGGACFRFLRAY